MVRKAFFILSVNFLITISPPVRGGDTVPPPASPTRDLTELNVRIPEKEYFDSCLSLKDYQYGSNNVANAGDNFFGRLWKRVLSWVNYGLRTLQTFPLILRIVFYALCLMVLYVIIIKTKLFRVFYTDREVQAPDYFEVGQADEMTDFSEAVRTQVSKRNFRNAVRLLHLKILKELEEKGIIRYAREKTNRDYSREITDIRLRTAFFNLAGIYNRVWFGNYNLSEEEYERLSSGFYLFSKEINEQKE